MQVAYFNPPKTISLAAKFADLIEIEKCNLIKKQGLHMMVTTAPMHLSRLLTLLDDTDSILLILKYLVTKRIEGRAGFFYVVEYAPESLPAMLSCIQKIENAPQLIAEVLAMKDDRRWTGLHVLAKFAPKQLTDVLDFIEPEINSAEMLKKAWESKNETGHSAAHFVEYYAPESVDRLKSIINTSYLFRATCF